VAAVPDHRPEVIAPRTYLVIFAALLVLTGGTWGVAYAPLGAWHTPAALAIAFGKAALVVLFFMHVIHSPRLTWAVILSALFFVGIMLTLTFSDYVSRNWLAH
jgi:cytochrome c oxidase subunit 4